MIQVKNPGSCTGCLICEMVCSFHHVRQFSRTKTSIKVKKSIFNQEEKTHITISSNKQEENPLCDLCIHEGSPLCVKFCPENVLKFERSHP
jgi:Fe-S-cluster-containing hydrogenase component 2